MRISETYVVGVDYDMGFKWMIEAGKYGHVYSDDVPEHFLDKEKSGIHMVEIVLVVFPGEMVAPQSVVGRGDMKEYRSTTLEEHSALGMMQSDIQRRFRMVLSPGSVVTTVGGHELVPYIGRFQNKRCYSFDWAGLKVVDDCCFALVRK